MRKRDNVMLAHPAEPKRIKALGDHFFVQPKLNGVRCKVGHDDQGKVSLFSSTYKEKPYLTHIKKALELLPILQFDGELYKHNTSWEWINSIASRTANPHPEEDLIEYHIFDIDYPLAMQAQRTRVLEDLTAFLNHQGLSCIKIVPTYEANQANWAGYLDYFTKEGYEGIMFRKANTKYERKRSTSLLKLKPTESDIYKIVGTQQGTGWCFDRLGAFVVEDKHGNQFEVGSGACLTADNRLKYWKQKEDLVGTYLLVKHELIKTVSGIPKCAVATRPLTANEVEIYKAENHNDL